MSDMTILSMSMKAGVLIAVCYSPSWSCNSGKTDYMYNVPMVDLGTIQHTIRYRICMTAAAPILLEVFRGRHPPRTPWYSGYQ